MNIAIVGATGLVGRKIIKLCEEFFDTSVESVSYTHLTLPTNREV